MYKKDISFYPSKFASLLSVPFLRLCIFGGLFFLREHLCIGFFGDISKTWNEMFSCYFYCRPLLDLYSRRLKTLDTIGNCQRPVFTRGVSQHMHKITNLWKFELNWSSKLRDNNERKKHHCHTKLCAFRWLISRPLILNLSSWNQIR